MTDDTDDDLPEIVYRWKRKHAKVRGDTGNQILMVSGG
jgi:hypothetical protein